MLLGVVDGLIARFPETRVAIHVGDVSHPATGAGDAVAAQRALDVGAELVHRFEYQLLLPFATAKTAVLATSCELAKRVSAGLPLGERGAAVDAVRNLGYDYSLRANLGAGAAPGWHA